MPEKANELLNCLKLIESQIDELKKDLNLSRNVEEWENVSVGVSTMRTSKTRKLKYIILRSSTPRKTPKGRAISIKSFPEDTPKEEIMKTEEFKKAKLLAKLIKTYKSLKEALENA